MRTQADILAFYPTTDDFLGFTADVLLPYLSAEQVRPFLKDDADLSKWEQSPLTREHVLAEMKEYMEFAWGKVQDHRGISAGRSVEKMAAWLWLLGDDETRQHVNDSDNYAQYGAPALKRICEVYGFPIPEGDDIANMSQGKKCQMGCTGCGS